MKHDRIPEIKNKLKKRSLASVLVLCFCSFCVYALVLYPKHFCEYEIWGSPPKALPFFMFHENDAAELDDIFAFLKNNNYNTLGVKEAIEVLDGKRTYTGKEVVLTFDDGKLGLWTITGPKLKEYGLRGIAFVNPGKVQRVTPGIRPQHVSVLTPADLDDYCSWQELKQLRNFGLEIQSHSQHHLTSFFYRPASHEERKEGVLTSLKQSRQDLVDKSFGPQLMFCAPFGSVSPTLIDLKTKAGYRYLIGVKALKRDTVFYGLENDTFSERQFVIRQNFKSVKSLPGKGREGVLKRITGHLLNGRGRQY